MKIFRLVLLLLIVGLTTLIQSCKEKNDQFPPRIWSEYVYNSSAIAPRTISAFFYENDHSVWLGSQGTEGLLHYDGYKWNIFDKTKTGVDFDSVTSMVRDGNGILWVGSKKGLITYDGSTWHTMATFDGLCVSSLAVEGIGNIIAGIKGKSGGIATLRNNSWTFYTLSNSLIPSGNVNGIVSDREQTLWLATSDKGIVRYKNNEWKIIDAIPLLSQSFNCISSAADGSIRAGSAASQLVHISGDTFTVLNTGTPSPIISLAISGYGNIWCSTAGAGLVKFDGISWTSYTMDNAAMPANDILCVANGFSGKLFFSIAGGKVFMINQ
jgi:ligand-binding sensor domain-containing protein